MTKEEALEITKVIKKFDENMPYFEALQKTSAIEIKVKFDAFVAAGFTVEQVLFLCK